MYLIQALNKKSRLTRSTVSKADTNGGFEMGTWACMDYLQFFEEAVGRKLVCTNGSKSAFAVIHSTFTKKECKLIFALLKKVKKHPLKESAPGTVVLRQQDKSAVHEKWFNRLLELFGTPGDVVWYSEGATAGKTVAVDDSDDCDDTCEG